MINILCLWCSNMITIKKNIMKLTLVQASRKAYNLSRLKKNHSLEIYVYKLIANNDYSPYYMRQSVTTHQLITTYKNGKIVK